MLSLKVGSHMQNIEKVIRNEQILRLVIEHTPAAVAMFDREMRYIAYSDRFLQDYNLEDQNLIGKSHYEVFPEISERWKEIHKHCLAGAVESAEADPFPRFDGKLDYVRWEIQPWFDLNGEIGGIILFSEVITEQKQAELNLLESQRKLQAILDNTDSLIYIKDLQGKLMLVNNKFKNMFGMPAKHFIGKTSHDLFSKEIADIHWENDQKVISNQTQLVFEEMTIDAAGIHTYLSTKFPFFDASEKLYAVCGISTDISDLKLAQTELIRSHEELRQVTSRLVEIQETERMNISKELHDRVGQNLTGLNISLNIIRSELDVETQQKLSDTFVYTQNLLDQVTDQIRELMAELHPPVLEDYGLAAALRWYAEQISRQSKLRIEVDGEIIEPRLELSVCMALFRISQEALNNVIKHAHANSVKIRLKEQDDFIVLSIVDDGSGFEPNLPVPISHPHWGLSTMKERARTVDGNLEIHSKPGAGTEILVRIPR